ncbi:reverse transcriptase domain-containing protein, partial [Tanacetum coccineum]
PVCEINVPEKVKSSYEDPPDLELKDLPSHLEYAFLEGDDKLPVIIAKNLKDKDKTALIKRRVNHKIHEVIKQEVIKLLDAGLIYPISDSPWVSPLHCVARPMTHLLEKETPFIFSKECIEAFETLKLKFTQALILVAPDWDLPFEIMCDASNFAIGAVLGCWKHEKCWSLSNCNRS